MPIPFAGSKFHDECEAVSDLAHDVNLSMEESVEAV